MPYENDFDLFSPPVAENPFTVYDDMRGGCPVAHSEKHGGYWIAASYQAVDDVAKDPELFSSVSISVPKNAFGDDLAERPPITLDPPRHGAFRRTLLPAFSPRQIKALEPSVREHARELLAGITGRDRCDAAAEYAKRIPSRFMARMIGCDDDRQDEFAEQMRALLEANEMEEIQAAMAQTQPFLDDLIEQRRREPGEDLVSCVLSAEIDGRKLTGPELIGSLVLIITAGIDTTWSALGSSLWHLARHPEDRKRLVAEPELIPTAVEEFLRAFSPVQIARVVTRDTEFHGAQLSAGDSILLGMPSANRDSAEFPSADRVDIGREVNRHLAFGVGIHRCIGSSMARMEMRIALEEWLRAIPEFTLAPGDAVKWSTGHVWGPRRLDLLLGAAEA
ncbi:cytochrome P450 [Kitasatospora sp. MAA19]|uniref:cytochrome P450 n=1 Tax=Kitasatospora sp. MAA19 TaxID=3035090 RepID=UPI00247723FC|nr:cytochrome P450 [Kitasatospora sp. MAA19]MDH6707202.1 cytochrome P450 [Kitasatospora sp. MAA19]